MQNNTNLILYQPFFSLGLSITFLAGVSAIEKMLSILSFGFNASYFYAYSFAEKDMSPDKTVSSGSKLLLALAKVSTGL